MAESFGSNGQSYTADFDSIAGVTNFNDGDYNLTPGVRSVGAVTFQVPVGVNVSAIQWSGSGGFGGAPGFMPLSATRATRSRPGFATMTKYVSGPAADQITRASATVRSAKKNVSFRRLAAW